MKELSKEFNGRKISLVRGDITRQVVDAIVNAANSGLRGGSGVDGAIHKAGGPAIMEECNQIRQLQGGCPPGQAVITGGGNLQAKYVIHAVGPIWRDGTTNEEQTLANAYKNSLALANQYECVSIAFPSISTGAYGFPLQKAAPIAISAARDFLNQESTVNDIRWVLFDDFTFDAFASELE